MTPTMHQPTSGDQWRLYRPLRVLIGPWGEGVPSRSDLAPSSVGVLRTVLGAPIYFKVAVKPVSTIGQAQNTSTLEGEEAPLRSLPRASLPRCRSHAVCRGRRLRSPPIGRYCRASFPDAALCP